MKINGPLCADFHVLDAVQCGGHKKSPRTYLKCRLYFTFDPLRSWNIL